MIKKIKSSFFRQSVLQKTFFSKTKDLLARFFGFFWKHKIITGAFIVIFLLLYFLIRILLGPFGFFAGNILSFTGFFGEKNYLILLQNENEIRPTGGFITSFATVKVNFGRIEFEMYGSEMVAIPESEQKAPLPIDHVMSRDPKFKGWVFRDSNFAPDFKVNADKAAWFLYQDSRFFGRKFDGVFAVDLKVIEGLVDLFEPIEFNGSVVTSSNLFQILQTEAKNFDLHNEEEWKNRKSSLSSLSESLLYQILHTPTKWGSAFDLLGQMADSKHFQLNFLNENLQFEIESRNWGGRIPVGDFFGVNFANLGGRKGDRFLQKDYWSSFYVDEDGEITERFTIRLAHEGTFNLQSDRYEAFIRILRPKGAKLISSNGSFETPIESGDIDNYTQISHFVALMPGEEKVFTYDLSIPQKLEFGNPMSFYYLKQPGTRDDSWKVVFRGANDTHFGINGCDLSSNTENVSVCDFILNKDRDIKVERYPDEYPPILQWSKFISLQELELRFSEKVMPSFSVNDVNIVDLNKKNKISDAVVIENITVSGDAVILKFSGITKQDGEFYSVSINNLKDVSGNLSTSNPFYTTTVQEL